jgi:hypothetical protein
VRATHVTTERNRPRDSLTNLAGSNHDNHIFHGIRFINNREFSFGYQRSSLAPLPLSGTTSFTALSAFKVRG